MSKIHIRRRTCFERKGTFQNCKKASLEYQEYIFSIKQTNLTVVWLNTNPRGVKHSNKRTRIFWFLLWFFRYFFMILCEKLHDFWIFWFCRCCWVLYLSQIYYFAITQETKPRLAYLFSIRFSSLGILLFATAVRPFVFILVLFCNIVCFDFLFCDLRWESLRYTSYFIVLANNYFRFTENGILSAYLFCSLCHVLILVFS